MARAHALSKRLACSAARSTIWFGRIQVLGEAQITWLRFPRPSARLETAARRIWWGSPYFSRSGNDSVNR